MKAMTIIAGIPAFFANLGTEAAQLGQGLVAFAQTAETNGLAVDVLAVATDVLTDVGTKTITPAQAVKQLQDVTALNVAAAGAFKAMKDSIDAAQQGNGATLQSAGF